jgi:hypothetical protein
MLKLRRHHSKTDNGFNWRTASEQRANGIVCSGTYKLVSEAKEL